MLAEPYGEQLHRADIQMKREFCMSNMYLAIKFGQVMAIAATCVIVKPAFAEVATSTFEVNASIASTCTLSATDMNFGEIPVAAAATVQTNSTSTITVTCSNGETYTVALNRGLNNVAEQRNAKGTVVAGDLLAYDLYKDIARGTVWTQAAAPVPGLGTGTAQVITIYGRVAAGLPYVANTTYTDQVLITLTY